MSTTFLFRPYLSSDRQACLDIFEANCPVFFLPNERPDFAAFLDDEPDYYELAIQGDKTCGAFGLFPQDEGTGTLCWIMLEPNTQGSGLGTQILARVIEQCRTANAKTLTIAASHKSAPFFEKFGARTIQSTTDGWGPGMHRIDMELVVADVDRDRP